MTTLDPNKQSTTWYGVLETRLGSVEVAWDPRLPLAPTGQVYLFNLERQAIVTYMWDKLRPLLRDVTGAEARQMRSQMADPLRQARKSFLKTHGSRSQIGRRASTSADSPTQPVSAGLVDIELEDAVLD
jgi:hypothetical protein